MQAIHSQLALHAGFSFQALLTFRSKWPVFLSSPCLRKVHKCPPFGWLKAWFFLRLLDLIHPMLWRFRPHSSKSPWPHLGSCSKSPLHTWFPVVASWPVTLWTRVFHSTYASPLEWAGLAFLFVCVGKPFKKNGLESPLIFVLF